MFDNTQNMENEQINNNEVNNVVNDLLKDKDSFENKEQLISQNKKQNRKFNKFKDKNGSGLKSDTDIEPQIDPELAKKNTKRFTNNQNNNDENDIVAQNVRNYKNKKQDKPIQPNQSNQLNQSKTKKIKETPIVSNTDKDKLMIAKNKNTNNFIYLPTKHRKANLMVLGLTSSGKTSAVLPLLANQDFKNKEVGCTLFVSDEEMVFKLYALARYYKRQVILVKPSTEIRVLNEFLWMKDYDYKYIKNNIVDFEDAILKRKIVIVDMEYFKYRENSKEAVVKLLSQYQVEMYNAKQQEANRRNKKTPTNYLYVDDSDLYIRELIPILELGKSYNVNTTIFLKNRDLLLQDGYDYRPIIESNIRNYIIMNGVGLNDAKYFGEKYNKSINDIIGRKNGEILYEILDESNSLAIGQAIIYQIDIKILQDLDKRAPKLKKQKINYCKKMEKLANGIIFRDNFTKEDISNDDIPENSDIYSMIQSSPDPFSKMPDNYQENLNKSMSYAEDMDLDDNSDKEVISELDQFIQVDNDEAKEKTIIDELNPDEQKTFDEINKKYKDIDIIKPSENKKDISAVMESVMNKRHYLDPEKIDFNK